MVQTHISAVFLAGEEVYKLKQPVRFSFTEQNLDEAFEAVEERLSSLS